MKAFATSRFSGAASGVLLALGCHGAFAQSVDELNAQAMEDYALGHYVVAAEELQPLAAQHHLRSLEVLGFMHWFGAPLYGVGEWDHEQDRWLVQVAAAHGNEAAAATLHRPQGQFTTRALSGNPLPGATERNAR